MSISSLLSQLVDIFRNWSHDTPEPYVLPAATTTTLGGVKVGDNLTVAEDGTLSGVEPVDVIWTITGDVDTSTFEVSNEEIARNVTDEQFHTLLLEKPNTKFYLNIELATSFITLKTIMIPIHPVVIVSSANYSFISQIIEGKQTGLMDFKLTCQFIDDKNEGIDITNLELTNLD